MYLVTLINDTHRNGTYIRLVLTHLAYRANAKKTCISNDIVTILKARGKRAQADINCYCKMTSAMALDGVSRFMHIHVNVCDTVQLLAGSLQCNDGMLEEAE